MTNKDLNQQENEKLNEQENKSAKGYDLYQLRSERKGAGAAYEIELEKKVIDSIRYIDNLNGEFKDEDFVIPTTILADYKNPTREEINRELNRLTAIMVYISRAKAECQLLVENKKAELEFNKARAREACKKEFDEERVKWINDIFAQIENISKSTLGQKLVPTLKTTVEKSKPAQPTEKDYEAYIAKNGAVYSLTTDLNILSSRLALLTETSFHLNRRLTSVMEFSKQINSEDITNKQYARNN